MIITVRIKNFYSIREEAVLDFTADTSTRKKKSSLPENLIDFSGDRFVNIIGLFGSNAAGKSNIIKAIGDCRRLVLTSHLNTGADRLGFEPFKFAPDSPSEFYMNFVAEDVEYEYEFHIHKGEIIFEELHHYPKKRKAKIFTRDRGEYSYGKGVIERPADLEESTGSKTLFLSRASNMNRKIPQIVYNFFNNRIVTNTELSGLSPLERDEFDDSRDILLKALEVSDSDIVDIRLDTMQPGNPRLLSFHRENPSIPFDFEEEESEGTKRLLSLLRLILKKSSEGAAMFIDEFDLKLHLRLGEFLLDTVRASNCGQMVFTSHNPLLIDSTKLRPEQIVFVTKHSDGNSEFVPLSDYEDLNKSTNIQQAYLQGRFDAVPYVGSIYPLLTELMQKR